MIKNVNSFEVKTLRKRVSAIRNHKLKEVNKKTKVLPLNQACFLV